MVTPTPATEGVDANGIVVGKWKMGLFSCAAICIPNGAFWRYGVSCCVCCCVCCYNHSLTIAHL